jgi:glycerophosphoryl diester phosphodiesterase
MKKMKNIKVIAHRGGQGPHLENTLDMFLYAIRIGFNAVEMDVRYGYFSRRFFLEHDFLHHPRFRRNYMDKIIKKIPGKIFLVIELKTNSALTNIFAKNYCKLYNKLLKKRKSQTISFNPFILYRIRKINPDIKLGFVCGSLFFKILFHWVFIRFIKPDSYFLNKRFLNRRTVRFAKKHGMEIYTYVINKNEDRHKVMDMDVDGIVTDYPL